MNKAKRISVLLAAVCLMLSACGQHPVLSEQTEQTAAPAQSETTQPFETAQPETVPTEAEETTQPTAEGTEPVLPETEPSEETFVRVTDCLPDIEVELKYASGDNFTGKVIYPFDTCYLRYGTVKKLMAVQDSLRERGLGLKIWDGFRPVSAQFALWEVCPDPTYVANPETGYSSHSRGNTVDLTLVDADGKELTMPTGFDSFSSLADRDYSDCPEEARENALLLQNIMEEKGFTGYFGEWWHFSDTVKYDVERVFDPVLVAQRYARCEEFISLRTEPDTSADVITRIPVGGEFTLLGYTGDFSMVEYRGRVGYVLTSYTSASPVEQSAPDLWTPNCEEYITLRKSKGGEALTRIPLGEEPFGAAETKALRDYTLAHAFDATVSYHASGCVIYWEYGTRQPVNDRSLSLAKQMQTVTGYLPQGSEGIDGAGYKDWVIEELGIPSVTVEIGTSMAPLAERELYATFARNRDVFSAVAQWLE